MSDPKPNKWQKLIPPEWRGDPVDFDKANAEAIRKTIHFGSPDGAPDKKSGGIRVVVNMASAHVPDFCQSGYKNVYELSIGGKAPGPSKSRQFVDKALEKALKVTPEKTYFAAVELTGAGIRFYGDICLVMKVESVDRSMNILDRNSYDLIRSPIREEIKDDPALCAAKVTELSGFYDPDLEAVAVLKVMRQLAIGRRGQAGDGRRLTAGAIAEQLRADEDYIEILWEQPITVSDVAEARVSAGDAAEEALVSAHLMSGPVPSVAQLTYRDQRHAAERSLRRERIPVRIVTTSGRVKG